MNYTSADVTTWPEIGGFFCVVLLFGIIVAAVIELIRLRSRASRDNEVRQLVARYEQLAESTLDLQQRAAVDLNDLRTRITTIESILRSVE